MERPSRIFGQPSCNLRIVKGRVQAVDEAHLLLEEPVFVLDEIIGLLTKFRLAERDNRANDGYG